MKRCHFRKSKNRHSGMNDPSNMQAQGTPTEHNKLKIIHNIFKRKTLRLG